MKRRSPRIAFTLAFIVAVVTPSALIAGPPRRAKNPYEHYLPQSPPEETNRVHFTQGYSIVKPTGWEVQIIRIESWMKDDVADQVTLRGQVADDYPPRITIQHLGPGEYTLYKGWLESTNRLRLNEPWTHTQFQGKPALTHFSPGYGKRRATGNWLEKHYEPWLSYQLFCERDGNGFILDFDVRNADKDKPYYTELPPIISQYLGTFRFEKPKP